MLKFIQNLKNYIALDNDIVKKNLWYLGLSEVISRTLNFICLIFIARQYGVDNFGLLGFVATITFYFMYVINFGYDIYGTGEIARLDKPDSGLLFNDILSVKIFSLIPSLILALFLGVLLFNDQSSLIFFLIYVIILIPHSFSSQWYFLGVQKTKIIPRIRLIESLTYLVLVLYIYYYLSETFIWISIVTLFAKIVSNIYAYSELRKTISIRIRFNWNRIKSIISKSYLIGLSSVFALLYLNFDVIMLGFMKNNFDVGIYNSAIKIFLILVIPFAIIFSSFYPSLSKSYNDKSNNNIGKIFVRYFNYQIITGVTIMTLSLIFSPLIINLFLGGKYIPSIIPLRILSINILIVSISFAFGNPLIAWRKQKYHTISLAAGALTNIGLNFILIPQYSYIGAAYATVVSEIVVCTLLVYFFYKYFGNGTTYKIFAEFFK